MNKHRSIRILLGACCVISLASAASGQISDAAQPTHQLPGAQTQGAQNDIIVTAQKRTQRVLDVPQSISVISGESLDRQHAQRLSDYLTRIPSANIVESQPGNSRIVLRGINAGGVGATVATYIDETPFGSATSLANGGVLAPDLDPFDLARVEVLRGPQGTLYGANSLGGLVKYVTVAPDPRVLGLSAETGIDQVSSGGTGYWGRAGANVPLSDAAAFRISGFYRDDAGFIDDHKYGSDINGDKTYGGRLSFLVKPSSRLKIRASALMENIRSTVDVDPVTLRATGGKLEHSRVLREPNNIKYRLYNGTIDYDFGSVSLVSATSFGTLDQKQVEDASAIYGGLLSSIFGTPLGTGVGQTMTQRRFTQEVRLGSTGKQAIEWTLGGFYTHEKNRLGQDLYAVNGVTGAPIASFDGLITVSLPSRYSEYAGFANATWHIAPKFDLTGGGRWSHNKQSDVQNTNGALAGGANRFSGSSSDSVFTYSIAPTFKPNELTRIYARVAKGYRPGGPNAVSPLASANVPRQFGPDTTINYEVGVKTQTADHLFSLEVTAFLIDWKAIQLLAQVEGFGVNANGGSARSKGIEFTAGMNPSNAFSLYANGSYVDAYLTNNAPAVVGGVSGDALPYNPKLQATVGAEYEKPLNPATTAHAGISLHYTGTRYSDFSPSGQRRLRAFSQLDAHAGVDIARFRLDAFAHNITNSHGIVNLGFFGPVNGDVSAAVIQPRTIGLSLGYRY